MTAGLVAVIWLAMAACAPSPPGAAPPTVDGPPLVFVTLGGTETAANDLPDSARLRSSWVQLLFRESLPRRAVLVNLALPGATVAEALELQVPDALELEPSIVTVWFGDADAAGATPPAEYEADLQTLVARLTPGRSRVLLGVLAGDDAYAEAARRVASVTGAEVVEVTGVDLPLDLDEHGVVADTFAAVLGDVP